MSSAAAVDSRGPCGVQQADDWAYQRGGGDGGGRGGGGGGRGLQWNGLQWGPHGRTLLILDLLLLSHPHVHFLSFLGPCFAEKENPCTYCSFYSNAEI